MKLFNATKNIWNTKLKYWFMLPHQLTPDFPCDGEYKSYYRNGQIQKHYNFSNGRLVGLQLSFWNTGKLRLAYYNDELGRQNSEFKFWLEDGTLHCHDITVQGNTLYTTNRLFDRIDCKNHMQQFTEEDKLMFVLQHEGFKFLPEEIQ